MILFYTVNEKGGFWKNWACESGLGNGCQPEPSASAHNSYLDLDYSGYHKNFIQ